jgi:hypothetical protein
MADNICVIPFQGVDYPFHPRDITISQLRLMKQKYGPEYGAYASFVNLFLNGDADAIACAISMVLKKAGIKRPPEAIDYSPVEIFEAIAAANEQRAETEAEGEPEEDPTVASDDAKTNDGDLT